MVKLRGQCTVFRNDEVHDFHKLNHTVTENKKKKNCQLRIKIHVCKTNMAIKNILEHSISEMKSVKGPR